jgi:hypothetical protein
MKHNQKVDVEHSHYVTLKAAEQEIGVTRITLKKYLTQLGINPRSFHIRDRSLYISHEELQRVKQLKQNPTMLEQLRVRSP